MLRSMDDILGYAIEAEDGDIGHCKDFLFDDEKWIVRYMVADTGRWLTGRRVLLSPIALGEPDWASRRFPVKMTKGQVEKSPPLEENMPVSGDYEIRFANFYGYPYYWAGRGLWADQSKPGALYGLNAEDIQKLKFNERKENHLRSVKEVEGYNIQASDGDIGHIEDFIVDEESWAIRYVVVDTRNWLPGGKKVLISPEWASAIRWPEKVFEVELSREEVKNSPEYDSSKPINKEFEIRLYDFYGRPYSGTRL